MRHLRGSLLAFGLFLLTAGVANAATIIPDTTADDNTVNGNCTLREAIIAANTNTAKDACPAGSPGMDTIILPPGTYGLAVPGASENYSATGDLDVRESLEILGEGAAVTVLDAAGIDSALEVVGTSPVVEMSGVTLTGSTARSALVNSGKLTLMDSIITGNSWTGTSGKGAGLFNNASATLVARRCTVSNNTSYLGGGIYNGPGGSLTIEHSEVSGNTASANGAIYNDKGTVTVLSSTVSGNISWSYGGGYCDNSATLVVSDSNFTENVGTYGGAITVIGFATITNSTISGNTAVNKGGGIYIYGSASASLLNSTISGNVAHGWDGSAAPGGAIYEEAGSLSLTHVTVTGNTTPRAGDGLVMASDPGTMTFSNSLLANTCSKLGGTLLTNGGNIESPGNTCGLTAPSDRPNVADPMIGPLQDNAGPTWTHALLPGSPAIDAAVNANCPSTDQRAVTRPFNSVCDVGSFEWGLGGSIDIDAGATYATDPSVTLGLLIVGPPLAEVRLSNECFGGGQWHTLNPTEAWTLLPGDGVRTVYAQFRDPANPGVIYEDSDDIVLDTTPPVFSSVRIDGIGPTSLGGTVSATDPTSGIRKIEYAVGLPGRPTAVSGGFIDITPSMTAVHAPPAPFLFQPHTPYLLSFRLTNSAGLEDTQSVQGSFAGLSFSSQSLVDWDLVGPTYAATFTIEPEDGILEPSVEVSLDGAAFQFDYDAPTATISMAWSGLALGNHELRFEAQDLSGNALDETIHFFVTDPNVLVVNPAFTVLDPSEQGSFSASSGDLEPLTWSLKCGDLGSDCGTLAVAPGGRCATLTAGEDPGTYAIVARDSLGRSDGATFEVRGPIDLDPPNSSVGLGESRAFTASGGTPPYTWQSSGGSGIPSGPNNSTYTYTAGTQTGSFAVLVRDATGATSTATLTVLRGHGRAILVGGSGSASANPILGGTDFLTRFAYKALTVKGFERDEIYYLAPYVTDTDCGGNSKNPPPFDGDGDGNRCNDVDGETTKANLEYAITDWARNVAGVGPNVPLWIYLMDHGMPNEFLVNQTCSTIGCDNGADNTITASELDAWLDELQTAVPGTPIYLVYDACYSGSFVEEVSAPDRVLVFSSAASERSYYSHTGSASFSSLVFSNLVGGLSLRESLVAADLLLPSAWPQTPGLDDNGNGILNDSGDGNVAKDVFLGTGAGGPALPVVAGGTGSGSWDAEDRMRIKATILTATQPDRVWVALASPSDPAKVTEFDLIFADDPATPDWEYEAVYPGFTEEGIWKLFFSARVGYAVSLPREVTLTITPSRRCGQVGGAGEAGWLAVLLALALSIFRRHGPDNRHGGRNGAGQRGSEMTVSKMSKPNRSIRLFSAFVLLACLAYQNETAAATITPTTTDDDNTVNGNCTLREAVIAANTNAAKDACPAGSPGKDTIILPPGTYSLAVPGAGENYSATGDLDIREDLDLLGEGASVTTLDAAGIDDMINIPLSLPRVLLSGVTVTGATTVSGISSAGWLSVDKCVVTGNSLPGSNGKGGGISNAASGTVLVTNSIITNNYAHGGGGAYNYGAFTVEDSVFTDNTASAGGGILNDGGTVTITRSTFTGNLAGYGTGSYGGAYWGGNGDTLVVTDSTFTGNEASNGAAIGVQGTALISNSTLSGNTAIYKGGAVYLYGSASATIRNSTISGNKALGWDASPAPGGAIYSESGSLVLTHVTLTDNTAPRAGDGIAMASDPGTVTFQNSLLGDACWKSGGSFVSSGGNVESPGNTCWLGDPSDQVSVANPMIGPLADNAGPTLTHALLPGSPAIDAALNENCPETDQRGASRPFNSICDTGAFEWGLGASLNIDAGASYAKDPSVTLGFLVVGPPLTEVRVSNEGFGGGQWHTMSPTEPWTLVSGDGVRTVYAQFRDPSNPSVVFEDSDSIILDMTPPVFSSVTIQSLGPRSIRGAVLASDPTSGIAKIEYAVGMTGRPTAVTGRYLDITPAMSVTYEPASPFLFAPDTPYVLSFRLTNEAGLDDTQSATGSFPGLSLTSQSLAGDDVVGPVFTATFAIRPEIGIIEPSVSVALDGRNYPFSYDVGTTTITVDINGLSLGNHVIHLAAQDLSGNALNKTLSFLVVDPNILVLNPAFTVLERGEQRVFTGTGGTPGVLTWTINCAGSDCGALDVAPDGRSVTLTAGQDPGTYSLTAKDSQGRADSAAFAIDGSVHLAPTTMSLGLGAEQVFAASGGTPPYTWLSSGGSGTPSGPSNQTYTYTAGSEVGTFAVRAQDSAGGSYTATVVILRDHGRAIIVGGGGSSNANPILRETEFLTRFAYKAMNIKGFDRDDIYYLTPYGTDTTCGGSGPKYKPPYDGDGDGIRCNDIDGEATKANLHYAVTDWAKNVAGVGPNVPLWIYLMDHGMPDQFLINQTCSTTGCSSGPENTVTAVELDGWLDELQAGVGGGVPIYIVYDACYSGSFAGQPGVDPQSIAGPNRVLVLSSNPTELSYYSANGSASFSSYLFTNLLSGLSLMDSFTYAVQGLPSSWHQTPGLDDNGNGFVNDCGGCPPPPPKDGDVAKDVYLGAKAGGSALPLVLGGTQSQTVSAGEPFTLEATVLSNEQPTRVWVSLISPQNPPTVEDVELSFADDPETPEFEYTGTYPRGFNQTGDWHLFFSAQVGDVATLPREVVITVVPRPCGQVGVGPAGVSCWLGFVLLGGLLFARRSRPGSSRSAVGRHSRSWISGHGGTR